MLMNMYGGGFLGSVAAISPEILLIRFLIDYRKLIVKLLRAEKATASDLLYMLCFWQIMWLNLMFN